MNAGKIKDLAEKWAQSNADSDQKPRWLHLYNGNYWISRTPVEGAKEFKPGKKANT